jgi:predicted nucleotidyltransferase
MNYGLTAQDIKQIQEIFSRYPVKQALLYGSRALGTFKPASDIDITLKGEQVTTWDTFAIAQELEELFIPYRVDLSIYHQIENPEFLEHVNRAGVVFYENSKFQ